MLTRNQHRLLCYLWSQINREGVPPSFDEMKDELGLKSKSGIHRLILGLEERGFIRRLPNRARALEVIKLPENVERQPSHNLTERPLGLGNQPSADFTYHKDNTVMSTARASSDQGVFSRMVKHTGGAAALSSDTMTLPLLGRIAAGTPIEALRDETTRIDVPCYLVGQGEYFALEVEGDSMIEEGIFDRDTVVIRRCDTAETGHIVVALIDGMEVTLKRLRRRGNSIALEPANKNYETRIFGPDRVRIQGVLTGLIRRYES